MGAAAATNVYAQIHTVDGHDVCRVDVKPSGFPVDATVTVVKKGQHETKTVFYVRQNNKVVEITDEAEKQKYIGQQWGAPERHRSTTGVRDPDACGLTPARKRVDC